MPLHCRALFFETVGLATVKQHHHWSTMTDSPNSLTACVWCAGSCHGSSLVVMSKGTRYTQQSYKVSDAFPFEWIKKKWKENFYITSMATAGVHYQPVQVSTLPQCVSSYAATKQAI